MVHLIVASTCVHLAPNLPHAAAVALWPALVNLAQLARHTLFSLLQPRNAVGPLRRETTGCHVIPCFVHVKAHVVVLCSSCPMTCHKSGADRCGADRGKPFAADLGRCAACATGARAESRREADRGCCQCHRSWRKSWSSLLVRSSATLLQASGDSTGGRAHIEQIVDILVPQILKQNVEVIKGILQEQCQRMLFFNFESVCSPAFDWCFWSVGEGCGTLAKARATARVDVPTDQLRLSP